MDILAVSAWLRYLERCGERFEFPSNGYVGDYILPIADALFAAEGTALLRPAAAVFARLPADEPEGGDKDVYIDALDRPGRNCSSAPRRSQRVLKSSLDGILADIRGDLEEFRVTFDCWFSERSLGDSGAIDRAIDASEGSGPPISRTALCGSRARISATRRTGSWSARTGRRRISRPTSRHIEQARARVRTPAVRVGRGSPWVHRASAGRLGRPRRPGGMLRSQADPGRDAVSRGREGEDVKRSGDYVTLRELRKEVGNDAARLFYVMRSNDQHLDFDLELAKARSNDNPVYYIQYAHARVASVRRQIQRAGDRARCRTRLEIARRD